jgi:thiol-disulfide isomerase/thioredoxin
VKMTIATSIKSWRRLVAKCLLILTIGLGCLLLGDTQPALAKFDNDTFDGNIFVLYAGNGSLVPPKVTLAQSLKGDKPTLLVFYTDDSKDCKQYAPVVSRLQAYYGRATDFLLISVDAIAPKSTYTPDEPGYYYSGFVPCSTSLVKLSSTTRDKCPSSR